MRIKVKEKKSKLRNSKSPRTLSKVKNKNKTIKKITLWLTTSRMA